MSPAFTINCLTRHLRKRTHGKINTLLLFLLGASLFGSTNINAQLAPVNPPLGGFQIDGGLRANTPTSPSPWAINQGDWYPGTGGTGGSVFSSIDTPFVSATSGHVRDTFNSTSDNIFTTGSKFNDSIPALQWTYSTAPNKNDINNALYHISRDAQNNQWAFIAGDRLSTNGTSYIDFEFLQGTLRRNSNGTFTGSGPAGGRTINDMLISMEYTNGGTKPNVYIYQWVGTPGNYSFKLDTIINLAANAFAETNRTGTETNLPYVAFGSNTYQQYAFVEAAINISYLLKQEGLACGGLNIQTLWVKTKASSSSTAALKDFVDPISVNFHFGSTSITNPGPWCSNKDTTITLTATPSGGTFTVDGQAATTFNPSVAGAGKHYVAYNYSGCSALDSFIVYPAATATAGGPYSMCASDSSISISATYGGGAKGGSFTSPTSGAFTNLSRDSINKTVSATYKITSSDISNGSVTLVFTTTGQTSPCGQDTVQLHLTIKANPAKPTVAATNNCDTTSTLTASNYTGSLKWSTGETTPTITVKAAGVYTVTQTVNNCTSLPANDTAAPKVHPLPPTASAVNNCDGTSTLTASNFTGHLIWNTGDTTISIKVNSAGIYTVTQTVNGCISAPANDTAAPRSTPPAPAVSYTAPLCDQATFSVTVTSVTSGAVYSILDKNGNAISGVSPSSPYTAPNTNNITFGNIPAGSGYKVSVAISGCPSIPDSCGTTTPPVPGSKSNAIFSAPVVESNTKVVAAPNPFNDRIRFFITPGATGNATLELYNMLGMKMKTVFQGHVEKGQVQTIEYSVPGAMRTNLIYVFIVGGEKVSGKLIGLK